MYNLNFLLKYISMETMQKILDTKKDYFLKELSENFRNFNLNMDYILKYGISINDDLVFNNLEELIQESFYENKIKELEKRFSKEEIIMLIENI